jgi:hypothetical protein
MKSERDKREMKLNTKELDAHKNNRGFDPEEYEANVEKRIKEKNITDPGDRLVERAKIANEYRQSHGGKLPGGYWKSDQ